MSGGFNCTPPGRQDPCSTPQQRQRTTPKAEYRGTTTKNIVPRNLFGQPRDLRGDAIAYNSLPQTFVQRSCPSSPAFAGNQSCPARNNQVASAKQKQPSSADGLYVVLQNHTCQNVQGIQWERSTPQSAINAWGGQTSNWSQLSSYPPTPRSPQQAVMMQQCLQPQQQSVHQRVQQQCKQQQRKQYCPQQNQQGTQWARPISSTPTNCGSWGRPPSPNLSQPQQSSPPCTIRSTFTGECKSSMKQKLLIDSLVKDQRPPGIIENTLLGKADFNKTSFDLLFGVIEPKCQPEIEPMSLLEAFYLRIQYEREQLFGCDLSSMDIDTHFAKQLPTTLNKCLASLFRADKIENEKNPKSVDFEADIKSMIVTLQGSSMSECEPILLSNFTGSTKETNASKKRRENAESGIDVNKTSGTYIASAAGTSTGENVGQATSPVTSPSTTPATVPATAPSTAPATAPVTVASTEPSPEPAIMPATVASTEPAIVPATETSPEPATVPGPEPTIVPATEAGSEPAIAPGPELGPGPTIMTSAGAGTETATRLGTEANAAPGVVAT